MTRAVINQAEVLAEEVESATSFAARSRGLLGKGSIAPGYALWLKPCNSIHMFGMRFAIDAVFLDRENRVVKVARHVRPGRMCWGGWKAHSVLELAAGSVPEGRVLIGAVVCFDDEKLKQGVP